MKLMKKLLIASAIGMAFAGQAQALTTVPSQDGSLFLAVWDSSATGTYSYVQDLGYTINSFLPNNAAAVSTNNGGPATGTMTPDSGLTLAPFSTSFLSSFTGNLADLRWNVVAADNLSQNLTQNTRRAAVTTQVGTLTAGNITNSGLTTVTNNIGTAASTLNCATATTGCGSTSTQLRDFYGDNLGNGGLSTSQGLGGTLEMMYLTQNGTNPGSTSLAAVYDFYDNAYGRAVLSLSSAGQLTYSIAGAPVSEVPVPAALWLFGSGLLGLVGIGRRKSVAA